MATKGERQALLFLAAVALLGAGSRVWRSREAPAPSVDLDRQIAAVESPRSQGKGRLAKRLRGFKNHDSATRDSTQADIGAASVQTSPSFAVARPANGGQIVNLDTASAAEIERLPGVGPSLAKRIVANRDSAGPFGCLAALDPVRGIGPALLRRLDSLVTFSGAPRAVCSQR
jgi:competence ComEA-like helix-hairpin-helix protein